MWRYTNEKILRGHPLCLFAMRGSSNSPLPGQHGPQAGPNLSPTLNLKKLTAVNTIVIHCSASKPQSDIGVREIDRDHRKLGWVKIGYHYVIRRDGTVETGREPDEIGSHVRGHNSDSLGICLIGGIDNDGKPASNFTDAQWDSLSTLVSTLHAKHQKARIVGHRDLSPDLDGDGAVEPHEWLKACPSFDVTAWLTDEHILTSQS